MSNYEQAVFISYAWGGEREEIVNQIDQELQQRGLKIIRDKRDLGYKGSITKFMERIGGGNCVIVVISDKYLRSPNCMFELVEIAQGKQFHDRIFPIVLSDVNIYDPLRRIEYVQYWETKRNELANAIRILDPANLQGIREDMDLYDRIRDKISGLTALLKDMNTLTPDMHRDSDFNELYQAIEERLTANPAPDRELTVGTTSEDSQVKEMPDARSKLGSALPSQNIHVGGGEFSGPVQFGNSTQHIESIQNIYYISSALEKSDSLHLNEPIEFEYFEPETVRIPQGLFSMGVDPAEGIPAYETPQHEIFLPDYRIGKYPVTNKQYEKFIQETGRSVAPEMGWEGQKVPAGAERLPVAGVTWYDALAYCQWLCQKTGRTYVLPNEAQWEKACRGGKQTVFPWGNEFAASRCNQGAGELALVDQHVAQNEYGCFDFVGNVRQWTCSLWGEKRSAPDPRYAYPWRNDGRNELTASRQIRRVVRGSGAKDDIAWLRCSARRGQTPDDIGLPGSRHGFRVALND